MSNVELNDWVAYGRLEPFGEEQANLRAALILQTIVAMTPRKSRQVPPLDKFLDMLRPPEEKPKQTADQLLAGFAAAARRRQTAPPTKRPRTKGGDRVNNQSPHGRAGDE